MRKLGVFVGENGNWTFFKDIFADLSSHYDVDIFPNDATRSRFLPGRVNDWLHRERVRSVLTRNDVCFFEWASELLSIATQMPKVAPIVTRLHSFELADWAHRINWGHVDRIIFVSEAMRRTFIARYPEHAGKSVLVYNAIPIERFAPRCRPFDFSLGMLCNITPIKRIYEVVLLVKEMRDEGYAPILRIAGAPPNGNLHDRYYVAIRRLVRQLELEGAVHFDGHVQDPTAWLQNIDIFISNSYWEGMQTALLEAMATGCHCLAHSWEGVDEALPKEHIYVTEADLKRKLIAYAHLQGSQRDESRYRLIEIARRQFAIQDKSAAIREVIGNCLAG